MKHAAEILGWLLIGVLLVLLARDGLSFDECDGDLWCLAEVYDEEGLHDLAARTRCRIEEIRDLYPDYETCVEENTVPEGLYFTEEQAQEVWEALKGE